MSVKPFSLLYATINYDGLGNMKAERLLKDIMSDPALNPEPVGSVAAKFGSYAFNIQFVPRGCDEFTKIQVERDSIVIYIRLIDGYEEEEVAFDQVLRIYNAMSTWLDTCNWRHPVTVSKIQLLTQI